MGWLITLFVLTLLAILPLGVRLSFDASGFRAKVVAGPVGITVFPLPHKKAKPEKKKEILQEPQAEKTPEPQKEQAEKASESKPKKGGSVFDFLPLVRVGLDLLGDFRRKLRVDNLVLRVIVAGDDPCDVGILYGRAWAAAANLLPSLERVFVIKKRDIEVECDFTSSTTTVIADMKMTITLGRLLCLAVWYGIRAVAVFLRIQKKRKGGA